MYERFTDRARKVFQIANQKAHERNDGCIAPEHILLGMLREGGGVGCQILRDLGCSFDAIREQTERLLGTPRTDTVSMGKLPQTPRAKKVIEYAIEEARSLQMNYIGSEHLLLGILREADPAKNWGIAEHILITQGVTYEKVKEELCKILKLGEKTVMKEDKIQTLINDFAKVGLDDYKYNDTKEGKRFHTFISKTTAINLEWIASKIRESGLELSSLNVYKNYIHVGAFGPIPEPPPPPKKEPTFTTHHYVLNVKVPEQADPTQEATESFLKALREGKPGEVTCLPPGKVVAFWKDAERINALFKKIDWEALKEIADIITRDKEAENKPG